MNPFLRQVMERAAALRVEQETRLINECLEGLPAIRALVEVEVKAAALRIFSRSRGRKGSPPRVRTGKLAASVKVSWPQETVFRIEHVYYGGAILERGRNRPWKRRVIRAVLRTDAGKALRQLRRNLRALQKLIADGETDLPQSILRIAGGDIGELWRIALKLARKQYRQYQQLDRAIGRF